VRFLDKNGNDAGAFEHGAIIQIELTLRVHHLIDQPCFGIQITSAEGIVLWSANSQMMGVRMEPLAVGFHVVRWKLHANFSGNRYVVALGAGHLVNGEYKRVHRLDYAGHFDVMPMKAAGFGWLAPQPEISVL
jgi:lipopolysaccharide transport system ATP-binding protein